MDSNSGLDLHKETRVSGFPVTNKYKCINTFNINGIHREYKNAMKKAIF